MEWPPYFQTFFQLIDYKSLQFFQKKKYKETLCVITTLMFNFNKSLYRNIVVPYPHGLFSDLMVSIHFNIDFLPNFRARNKEELMQEISFYDIIICPIPTTQPLWLQNIWMVPNHFNIYFLPKFQAPNKEEIMQVILCYNIIICTTTPTHPHPLIT